MILQKDRYKKYIFIALGLNDLKIVFVLLTKIIAFYIQIAIIEVEIPGS